MNRSEPVSSDRQSMPDIPIVGKAAETQVPDFLNAQQQDIYRKAYSLGPVFQTNTPAIDINFENPGGEPPPFYYNPVTINGQEYQESTDRYSQWEDFKNACLSVYTPDFFATLADDLFIDVDGKLYYQYTERGYDPLYKTPDTFELLEENETSIKFQLIGHYYTHGSDENGVQANTDTTTKEFPITMVNTPDGWRFSEFHIPF